MLLLPLPLPACVMIIMIDCPGRAWRGTDGPLLFYINPIELSVSACPRRLNDRGGVFFSSPPKTSSAILCRGWGGRGADRSALP